MSPLRIFAWEPSEHAIPPKCGEQWDAYAFHFLARDFNVAPLWYLTAAHAYYVENSSIFSDDDFDYLARLLLEHKESLSSPFAALIDDGDLRAGTYLGGYYPEEAVELSKKCRAVTNKPRNRPSPYAHKHYEMSEL